MRIILCKSSITIMSLTAYVFSNRRRQSLVFIIYCMKIERKFSYSQVRFWVVSKRGFSVKVSIIIVLDCKLVFEFISKNKSLKLGGI